MPMLGVMLLLSSTLLQDTSPVALPCSAHFCKGGAPQERQPLASVVTRHTQRLMQDGAVNAYLAEMHARLPSAKRARLHVFTTHFFTQLCGSDNRVWKVSSHDVLRTVDFMAVRRYAVR
jgi:hypothetical protein